MPEIDCRPVEIGQVLSNLLNNAFDAVSHLPHGEVRLVLSSSQDKIHVTVSDNGAGVPKELQGKIFDAFFTTKDVGKGTGSVFLSRRG